MEKAQHAVLTGSLRRNAPPPLSHDALEGVLWERDVTLIVGVDTPALLLAVEEEP